MTATTAKQKFTEPAFANKRHHLCTNLHRHATITNFTGAVKAGDLLLWPWRWRRRGWRRWTRGLGVDPTPPLGHRPGTPGALWRRGGLFAPLPVPRRVSWGRFWARSGASTALPEEVQALQLQCPATGLALRGSSRPTWLSSTRTAKVIGVKHNCSKSDKIFNKGLHWFRRGFGRGVVHVELNALVKQIQTN